MLTQSAHHLDLLSVAEKTRQKVLSLFQQQQQAKAALNHLEAARLLRLYAVAMQESSAAKQEVDDWA